jgi:subtilisin family serine protease
MNPSKHNRTWHPTIPAAIERGPIAAILAVAVWLALAPACRADVYVPNEMPSSVVNLQTNQVVPLSAIQSSGSGLPAIGMTAVQQKYPFITGAGQTIAIIDTGIDYTNPALASRYVGGYDFGDNDSDPMDTIGHGTHVAGIAVSTDTTYRGVAPGANVAALKVFANGTNDASDWNVIQAMDWVVTNARKYNITAVNISLGDGGSYRESDINPLYLEEQYLQTLKNMGIFVACASGNDGFLKGISYPAVSKYAVSVGGTYANSDYSNYILYWNDATQWNPGGGKVPARMADNGPSINNIMTMTDRYTSASDGKLDLLAPGAVITSTYPIALDTTDGTQDGFTALMGTSMAAPFAASASMLVRQALEIAGMLDPDPAKQVDQILQILQQSGQGINDWYVALMEEAGLGNSVGFVQAPIDPANFYANWYIRSGTDATYPLINLDAAISEINPTPEPATMGLLAFGAVGLLLRRKRRVSK